MSYLQEAVPDITSLRKVENLDLSQSIQWKQPVSEGLRPDYLFAQMCLLFQKYFKHDSQKNLVSAPVKMFEYFLTLLAQFLNSLAAFYRNIFLIYNHDLLLWYYLKSVEKVKTFTFKLCQLLQKQACKPRLRQPHGSCMVRYIVVCWGFTDFAPNQYFSDFCD